MSSNGHNPQPLVLIAYIIIIIMSFPTSLTFLGIIVYQDVFSPKFSVYVHFSSSSSELHVSLT
jgi:hypothetical protein